MSRVRGTGLSGVMWLQVLKATLAFVLVGAFTAAGSPLGRYLSGGESPVFLWLRTHVELLLWSGLGLVLLVGRMGAWGRGRASPGLKALIGVELVALGAMAIASLLASDGLLAWGHVALQGSILLQILTPSSWPRSGSEGAAQLLEQPERRRLRFLSFLFVLAAAPPLLDPGSHRLRTYVEVDSGIESALSYVLPPLLSGITSVWLGVGLLGLLAGAKAIRQRYPSAALRDAAIPLTFGVIALVYGAVFVETLASAVAWEISKLNLASLRLPLVLLLASVGSVVGGVTLRRLASCTPGAPPRSPIGMAALSVGMVLVLPIAWVLTRHRASRAEWRCLLGAAWLAQLALGVSVLYGGLFDPWFTVFSYVKGLLLKSAATVAAGILVLVVDELRAGRDSSPAPARTTARTLAAAMFLLTAAPIVAFDAYPETKTAVLLSSEFAMVDATYARLLARALGLGRWIRLGQAPAVNGQPAQWPHPWTLEKTGRSRLPGDFNLLVIVVDALRGDAFHSAGYHRNLTPFLDRWALEEAVSFRRAYSQGGGTFAAFPFLVAGRSRFTLYGPGLDRENLYLKLAQAEGIRHWMVVKGYGPRAIFPPDQPVIELGPGGGHGRSASADETFRWLRDAVDALPAGDRFLAFLHVMDVHNDLWKKDDGLDFGDGSRELYDNNVSYLDRAFARFTAWLKHRGLYERTVILFTSDHGEQFWEHGASLHGHTLYEEEVRIPLILLAHGVRARVEDVPATAADIAPTIVDLAGYAVHPPYDDPRMGISLVPLLVGGERERFLRRDIVGRASFKRTFFFYRDWRWKLIYSADFDLLQLFDVASDPRERRNLVQEHPDLAAELERELLGYLTKVEGRSYRPLLSW